jgi:heme A synthase
LGIVGLIFVGATGAITALGDTLFPAESLFEGIRDDFSGAFLVRLRWVHPIVAVAVAAYVMFVAQTRRPSSEAGMRLADLLAGLVVVQLVAGVVNVVLLAPVWMQVVHLLLADVMWVAFVVFAAEMLTESAERPVAARTRS